MNLAQIFALMISRSSLKLGHLCLKFHGPVTLLSFSVYVSFLVTIGPTVA